MRTRTLTNLIADVRMWSSLGTSQAVTDTQITKLLNDSIYALTSRLVSLPGSDKYEKSASQATASGTKSYAIPADCYEVKYITQPDTLNPTQNVVLKQRAIHDVESVYSVYPVGSVFTFRLVGNTIVLYPTPTSVITLTVYYVPLLPVFNTGGTPLSELSTGTDYMDCGMSYDQWVVLNAAEKVLAIEELSTSEVRRQREQVWEEIVTAMSVRGQYAPKRLPASKTYTTI